MSFTVYILFSETCQRYYTGQTNAFENRLIEHNKGETKSIKTCRPWKMVWTKNVESRSKAMTLEKEIKSRGAARFLEDLGIRPKR